MFLSFRVLYDKQFTFFVTDARRGVKISVKLVVVYWSISKDRAHWYRFQNDYAKQLTVHLTVVIFERGFLTLNNCTLSTAQNEQANVYVHYSWILSAEILS